MSRGFDSVSWAFLFIMLKKKQSANEARAAVSLTIASSDTRLKQIMQGKDCSVPDHSIK